MGGSGAVIRQHATAVRIYKLAQEGYTNRQIAIMVGVDVKKVPDQVKLGERLDSLTPVFTKR